MLALTVPWCGPHCSQWHICKCTRGMWKAKWKPGVWGLRLSSGFRKWVCLTCLYTVCAQEHTHNTTRGQRAFQRLTFLSRSLCFRLQLTDVALSHTGTVGLYSSHKEHPTCSADLQEPGVVASPFLLPALWAIWEPAHFS